MNMSANQPHGNPDPYPRMIIVLVAITMLLFLLVAGVMFYDFVLRGRSPSSVVAPGAVEDGWGAGDTAGAPGQDGSQASP